MLDVVALEVEPDLSPFRGGGLQDGHETPRGRRDAGRGGEGSEIGGEGRRLDGDCDPAQRAAVVALENLVARPLPARGDQHRHEIGEARRNGPPPPASGCAHPRGRRWRRDRGATGPRAEPRCSGRRWPRRTGSPSWPPRACATPASNLRPPGSRPAAPRPRSNTRAGRIREVLLEVTVQVGIVGHGGQHVHEAEQLGPKRRVRHGPPHEALGPEGDLERPLLGAATNLGDAGRQLAHFGFGGSDTRALVVHMSLCHSMRG